MQLFYQPDIPNGILHLSEEESRHAVKVLRLSEGEIIDLTDGCGKFYTGSITNANQRKCEFQLQEIRQVPENAIYRHIAIAPTKNIDRIEWFVEKAVEFGIDRIMPIICDHSERRIVKTERLARKAISAMKQSLKAWYPQVDEAIPFRRFLSSVDSDHRFIAYVDNDNPTLLKNEIQASGNHLVLIGPEGDFSQQEVELAMAIDFAKVSLGTSRLRTETAGIAAIHLLNL